MWGGGGARQGKLPQGTRVSEGPQLWQGGGSRVSPSWREGALVRSSAPLAARWRGWPGFSTGLWYPLRSPRAVLGVPTKAPAAPQDRRH